MRWPKAFAARLDDGRLDWCYEELDPDVFGEELLQPAYAEVDRIAAVLLAMTYDSGAQQAKWMPPAPGAADPARPPYFGRLRPLGL